MIEFLVISVIVVEATTEILVASTLFAPLRDWLHKNKIFFFSPLFSCGYCMSVWVSTPIAVLLPIDIINVQIADKIILILLIHRLSNVFHEYINRTLHKEPIILCLRGFELEDIPETLGDGDDEE